MEGQARKDPFRVVITGGPCAGKTEVWRFLGEAFPKAVPVPEAATQLILAGTSAGSLGREGFQRAVYERQQELEEEALKRGAFLLCDRGLLDGLAYFPGLLPCLGVSEKDVLSRYAVVIQLEVIRDRRVYDLHVGKNPARHEEHAAAMSLETALKRLYERHPAYVWLSGSLQEKKREALRLIRIRLAALRPELVAETAGQA
jgi:predicted ATPase